MSEKRIDFIGKLDGRTVLGDGSVRYTARLTRTGVFDYGDHKELRVPEEVFKQQSIDSFKGLTVTVGHRAFIDPENWREHSSGHTGDDVHQDGDFLVSSVVVKDKSVIAKIDRKELVELSMGYVVNLDATPGVTADGEKYDSIQRDIVGNHAALGPLNWGRAGTSVRLLDGAAYAGPMTTPAQRIDAPAATHTDAADLAASRADNEAVRKERDTARTERDAAAKRADTAEAERDAAKKAADEAKSALEAAIKNANEKSDAAVTARIELLDAARGILGKDFAFAGTSDKDVRIAALAKVDAKLALDGKSDDYITARFDLAVESVKTDKTSLAQVQETAAKPGEQTKSRLDQAYEAAEEDAKKAAQAGPPAGARVRK